MSDKNVLMAHTIAERVAQAGGKTYYVGGLVRDRLMGRESKDVDIEVHGITAQRLRELLGELGEVTTMGASFGILGLRHYEIDISMPRRKDASSRGHRDFEMFVDPFLGPEKAAMRRDFTMNALMEDVLTGEILDFFDGRDDMRRGLIRHVSNHTFVEDPLRVLRAAQFAARFQYRVADETVTLAKTTDLSPISRERVAGELEKTFLKAERPSVFFETLREMEQLDVWFPEVKALIDVPQAPAHHPEGSVWNHTMMMLDEAATLKDQTSSPTYFMYAALTHDFGKAVTTQEKDGVIHAYGHEKEGLPLVEGFLRRLVDETHLIAYVLNMTKLHMMPNMMVAQGAKTKAYMKLFDRSVEPDDLLLLARADHYGRAFGGISYEESEVLQEKLHLYRERMAQPCVQGADLIAAGATPGPAFGEALKLAHQLQLAGVSKEKALPQVIGHLRTLTDDWA